MSRIPPSDTASVATSESSAYSTISVTSAYRHHSAGPFFPQTGLASPVSSNPPQPVLSRDSQHRPKTTGSVGILVVGLGGANGCTLLAGVWAHRLGIQWCGPTGEPKTPNYNGCITQLDQRGGGVGYKNRVKGLADVSLAAVGGWVSKFVSLIARELSILDGSTSTWISVHLLTACCLLLI